MRTIKRIIKIYKIDGFKIFCLFNNGESRVIDFKEYFNKKDISEESLLYPIVASLKAFSQVKLEDGTLTWKNVSIHSEDEIGHPVTHFLDLDPIRLYEMSTMDYSRNLDVGALIKKSRNDLGITQSELAKKSGTTKHYISKLENNKISIELSTLRKIIEGGLGKRMQIKIV